MKNLPAKFLTVALLICIGLGCRLTGLLTGRGGYFEGKNAKIAADAVREKIVKPFKITEVSIFGSIFSALKG